MHDDTRPTPVDYEFCYLKIGTGERAEILVVSWYIGWRPTPAPGGTQRVASIVGLGILLFPQRWLRTAT